jgi:hypothetical protein
MGSVAPARSLRVVEPVQRSFHLHVKRRRRGSTAIDFFLGVSIHGTPV